MAKEEIKEKLAQQPARREQDESTLVSWVEKNNKKLSVALIAVLGLVLAGYFLYNKSVETSLEGQKAIYPAQFYFGKDSLDLVLNGNDQFQGTLDIAKEYSGDVANLASFYSGVAYLQKNQYKEAISSLSAFSSDDELVQGRAYNLIGHAYLENGEKNKAIEYYKLAVDYKPNNVYTPDYIMDLARAYEQTEDFENAIVQYQRIVDNYSANSGGKLATLINEGKKYLGMAKAKAKRQ